MTYSVGPFDKHQKEKEEVVQKPHMAWSHQVLARDTKSSSPSQLQLWWFREKDKQSRGLMNEIDLADIRWALKGGKNAWSKRVENNRPLFAPIEHGHEDKVDWNEISKLT